MGYKQLPANPATGGEFEGDGMCACPACGASYAVVEVPCKHLVGDWCFTAGYDVGDAKGQWATAAGEDVLTTFEIAIDDLEQLFESREWRSEEERVRLLASLPTHLRDAIGGWSRLLDERIIAAPGYLGTHEVITDSMASDAWNVHWAEDGPAAAKGLSENN